jgi:hypothetical protein
MSRPSVSYNPMTSSIYLPKIKWSARHKPMQLVLQSIIRPLTIFPTDSKWF